MKKNDQTVYISCRVRTTLCALIISIMSIWNVNAQTLFTENFESVATTAVLPNGGWASFDVTAGNSIWGMGVSSCVISGTKSMFVCRASIANLCDYAPASITNKIAYKTFSAAGYQTLLLNFKWKCNGETIGTTDYDYGKVCYSTNGTTWTDLPTVYHLQTATQTVANLALPAALNNASTVYLGFRWINDISTKNIPGFVIDDISVTATAIPGCIPPSALTATGVTSSGATVSWTASSPAPASGYEYVVSTTSTAPAGSGTATASTSATVSLTANTTYYLFVRSICGSPSGNSSWAGPYSFTTPCVSITTIPYTEGFNSAGVIPTCWSTALISSTTNWITDVEDGDGIFTPHSGASMAVKNYDGVASDAILVSPPINLNAQPAQQVRLNVWIYRNVNGVNGDRVRFFVNTAPNLTGATNIIDVRTLITSAPVVASAGWYNYIGDVPLSFNAASSFYIIAEGNTTANISSYSVGFDDFRLENVPACPTAPVATLNSLSSNSAGIAFTCASCTGTYVVEYGAPGFIPGLGSTAGAGGTIITGSSSPIIIPGLNPNTSYDVYVRNNCGAANYSSNSTVLQITTPCLAITTLPYNQGFDNVGVIPSCWSTGLVAGTTNWITDVADGDGVFTPHTGAGMAVKNWDGEASDALLISPPFNVTALPAPVTRLSVWIYRNTNGVNGDRVRFFVNAAPNLTGAVNLIDVRTLTTSTPVVASAGWYQYTGDVPLSFKTGGDFYIIAEGNTTTSFSSYSVGFDDFKLEQLVCITNPTSPADGSSVCPTPNTTLSWPALSGATSYNVYFGTTNPATTLVSSNQVGLTYNAGQLTAGTYYWSIVPNLGATSCNTWSFTILPAPQPAISNAGSVCEGSSINLGGSNDAPGQATGNTYSWSTDAVTPFTSTSATANVTSSATVNNSGNYTVVITNSFLCTASATEVVTVNPNPILNSGSISSVINESCPGAADGSFIVTASSGAAPYDYSIDGGNSSTQTGSFAGLTPGTYTVQVISDFNGCISGTTTVIIDSPNSPPTVSCPGNQSANTAAGLCSAVVSYSTSSTGVPTPDITYVFAGATTGSGNGDGSGSAFNVGTTTVTVTASNSCGTVDCSFDVIVTDTENPLITCPANISVCDPGSPEVSFSFGATDNCSILSVVSTPASGSTFPPGTTTVNSIATDVNGNTSTCSFNVTVSAPSTAPTSATSDAPFNNICTGNSTNLTVNGGSLGTGATWKWYSGSCGGAAVGTGVSISVSPTITTTYFVRAEGACNNTTCVSVTITVNTSPVTSLALMPFTGMPANVCNGTVATLSITPVANATFYVWDAPTGSYFNGNPLNVSPFTTTTPSVTVTFGTPSGSLYNVGVQAGNACGSSIRQSQKVRGLTSVPASISGPLTACANSTVTYSIAAVTGASSYLWTITGNATVSGTGTTVTVNFGAGWTGGTLCVAAQTTCYTSPTKCISITTSASTLNTISGTFTACPNSTLSYSVPASSGAASYSWTSPTGSTIASGQGTNSVSVSFGPGYSAVGNICVSVTSTCGVTSAVKCKTVAPGLPSQPNSIAGPTNGLCGQSVVYSCPSQGAGVTYTWTVPSGASIVSGQGSTSVNVQYGTFTTGNVCVTANNSCGGSTARCVSVKGSPATPGAITATPGSWCANTSGIEFNVNVSGLSGTYTLNWIYPTAPVATYALGGGNSTQLVMDWGTGTGNINVVAYNACGSGTKTSTWSSTCREGEVGAVSTLTVSPNPTTGILNINYTATKSNTVINVLDLAGRVVMTQATHSVDGANTSQLDMSQLAKGAYMLSIQTSDGIKQVKIAVE